MRVKKVISALTSVVMTATWLINAVPFSGWAAATVSMDTDMKLKTAAEKSAFTMAEAGDASSAEPTTEAVPASTSETVPATSEAPDSKASMYGDANADGRINVADVTALNLYLIDPDANKLTPDGMKNADCQLDEAIDTFDSVLLMNYVAEIILADALGRLVPVNETPSDLALRLGAEKTSFTPDEIKAGNGKVTVSLYADRINNDEKIFLFKSEITADSELIGISNIAFPENQGITTIQKRFNQTSCSNDNKSFIMQGNPRNWIIASENADRPIITFEVGLPADIAEGKYTVSLSGIKAHSSSENCEAIIDYSSSVTANAKPLTITVSSVPKETTEAPSTSPAVTVITKETSDDSNVEASMYGDANADRTVNVADVTALNLYLIDPDANKLTPVGLKNADCQLDNALNTYDSVVLMNYVTEIILASELGKLVPVKNTPSDLVLRLDAEKTSFTPDEIKAGNGKVTVSLYADRINNDEKIFLFKSGITADSELIGISDIVFPDNQGITVKDKEDDDRAAAAKRRFNQVVCSNNSKSFIIQANPTNWIVASKTADRPIVSFEVSLPSDIAEGKYTVSLSDINVLSSSENCEAIIDYSSSVTANAKPLTITVSSVPEETTEAPSTSPAVTVITKETSDDSNVEASMYGDANADRTVNVADVTALNLYLIDPDANKLTSLGMKNADCQLDNALNTYDSVVLMNYVVEIISASELGKLVPVKNTPSELVLRLGAEKTSFTSDEIKAGNGKVTVSLYADQINNDERIFLFKSGITADSELIGISNIVFPDNQGITVKDKEDDDRAAAAKRRFNQVACSNNSKSFIIQANPTNWIVASKTADGPIVTFEVSLPADIAEGKYTVSLSDINVLSSSGNCEAIVDYSKSVTANAKPLTITVTGAASSTEPSSAAAEAIFGDVDEDGYVGVSDVVRLNKYLLNALKYPLTMQGVKNADCNYDNNINTSDSTILIKYIAMLESYDNLAVGAEDKNSYSAPAEHKVQYDSEKKVNIYAGFENYEAEPGETVKVPVYVDTHGAGIDGLAVRAVFDETLTATMEDGDGLSMSPLIDSKMRIYVLANSDVDLIENDPSEEIFTLIINIPEDAEPGTEYPISFEGTNGLKNAECVIIGSDGNTTYIEPVAAPVVITVCDKNAQTEATTEAPSTTLTVPVTTNAVSEETTNTTAASTEAASTAAAETTAAAEATSAATAAESTAATAATEATTTTTTTTTTEATTTTTTATETTTTTTSAVTSAQTTTAATTTVYYEPVVTKVNVEVKADIIANLKEGEELPIEQEGCSFVFDSDSVAKIKEQLGDDKDIVFDYGVVSKDDIENEAILEVIEEYDAVLSFDLKDSDGNKIVFSSEDGGKVTITVPYNAPIDAEKVEVYYISEDGTVEKMENAYYDPAAKTIRFDTTHFSYYAVKAVDESGEAVKKPETSLPQTGNNVPANLVIAASAVMLTFIGAFIIMKSGIVRRRKETE